jgi:hypothetical protein
VRSQIWYTRQPMCDIPIPIDGWESIARAILSIHLDDKGKLKTNTFRPKPGKQDVSVMRHSYMGSDACKAKAKGIRSSSARVEYKGLAVIGALQIRKAGSEVTDSREGEDHYCGHADLSHGIANPPPGEPDDPMLIEKLRALKKAAQFCLDPDPSNERWTGAQIL